MILGSWFRRAEQPPALGAQLERAVRAPATAAVGGGWGGLARLRAPSLLVRYLRQTVFAGMLVETQADTLCGVVDGQQAHVGECRLQGWLLRFAVWVPHFGIALDVPGPSDEEIVHKQAWCDARGILYIHLGADALRITTGDIIDAEALAQVRELVAQRRALTVGEAA